jgi:polysaccharide export outer membrane protein
MPRGNFLTLSVVFIAALPLAAQQLDPAHPIYAGISEPNQGSNLPIQKVGPEDLLGLQVYDAPEFTRTVRISADGTIRLPMLKEKLRAEGLFPSDIEVLLAEALKREGLFVDPFVTVNVVEYHSRPISVGGMVRTPVIFQAVGKVTLLDALARAGGVVPDISGITSNEVVVSRPNGDSGTPDSGTPSVQHIPLKLLMSGTDPALNLTLLGGEEIRVPDVGKIVVTGNVVRPGVYPFLDPAETNTVKSAVGQAWGMAQYWGNIGYIYRTDPQGKTNEITIPLRKIMERKAPDVILQARDVLYIPDSSGRRITQETVTMLMGLGPAATSALIYMTKP